MSNWKQGLRNVAGMAFAGAVVSLGVLTSEKTGLTDAFVDYNEMVCKAAFEAHNKYPSLVWSHYGNPEENPEIKQTMYRIGGHVGAGLLSLMSVGIGSSILDERKFSREINSSNNDLGGKHE
ncbi:MAG: hypothetical protein ACOCUT_04455 [bacterium]